MREGNNGFFIKANKKSSTVLCSAVKRIGSGSENSLDYVSCFPYTSFVLYCFQRALQQNRPQSRLLYLFRMMSLASNVGLILGSEYF